MENALSPAEMVPMRLISSDQKPPADLCAKNNMVDRVARPRVLPIVEDDAKLFEVSSQAAT
jgi:hypothetical protein